MSTNVGAYG